MRKLGKKEGLLRLLLRGAQENDCYTVHGLCRKIGIPYEQIQRWTHDNAQWAAALEACRERCLNNVEMAVMMKRMKSREALKYMNNIELPF